ncbi:ribosomal protein S7 domain-containing protein [Ephemerocybe angulata]|uniref:Ribosomal protein S7 domain-containing protein n=1 Tax=Ephemerocybe angulata TaxID=980116 RepID=A0A8H6M9X1_9AGAR|nr:ribosomal protein S7 domain-containing protein [Tulosesus angulatus]
MLSLWRPAARRTASQCTRRTLSTTPSRRLFSDKEHNDALNVFAAPPPTGQSSSPSTPTTGRVDGGITTEALAAKSSHAVFEVPPDRDPLLHYMTNLIMKHGQYSRASKIVSEMLLHIHTLTRSPPMPIVREAIFKVSPAVRVSTMKMGARVVVTPVSLSERQRTGQGIRWLLEASNNKPGTALQERLAKEIVAVVKGESGALEKKLQMHRSAMVARGSLKTR